MNIHVVEQPLRKGDPGFGGLKTKGVLDWRPCHNKEQKIEILKQFFCLFLYIVFWTFLDKICKQYTEHTSQFKYTGYSVLLQKES